MQDGRPADGGSAASVDAASSASVGAGAKRVRFYNQPRHHHPCMADAHPSDAHPAGAASGRQHAWRIKSRRTFGGVLAVCLNSEAEPPDEKDVVVTLEGQLGDMRKLSERFAELEECRKRGFVTEEEYAQKRAMLMASF